MAIIVNSLASFILASRPKTLGAIICPVLIGSSLALRHQQFKITYFCLTLICAVLLQILANLVNDYGDFIKGSDNNERLGPPRAMQMGFITERAMCLSIIVVLVMTTLFGLILVKLCGWPIFLIGAVSVFLCMWYTLGKKPLAYLGFAEIVVFIVFGPLATLGAYYVQTKSLAAEVFFISLTPGFLSAALLLTNNVRDMVQDKKNKKLTIAVRFGDRCARFLVLLLVLLSSFGPLILVFYFSYGYEILLSQSVLILPLRYFPMIWSERITARFNLMLASLGQALYLLGVVMSMGIIYGAS